MRALLQTLNETIECLSVSTEANQWERVLEIVQRQDGLLQELSEKIASGEKVTRSEAQLLKNIRERHEKSTEVITQHKDRVAQLLAELSNGKQAIVNFKKMNSRRTHFVDFLH